MLNGLKKLFWKLLDPLFPTIRDVWVFLGFMEHNYRQPFVYGRLKADLTLHDMRQFLQREGFTNDYIAWIDPGEVLNMRKIVDEVWQYHVRLFEDGEVKAHHEYTAEAHPWKHLFERGMTEGGGYLRPLLAPLLVAAAAAPPSTLGPK